MSPPLPLLLALAWPPLARAADAVVVPLSALAPAAESPEVAPVAAVLGQASVTLEVGETSRISATLPFVVLRAGWVDLALPPADLVLDASALDGRPWEVTVAAGQRRLVAWLEPGPHQVRLSGTVPTPGAALDLDLGAFAGAPLRLSTRAPGFDVVVDGAVSHDRGFDLPPRARLTAHWAPARPAPPRPRVIQVETHAALRADEAGVEGRARLRYRIVHGTAESLSLSLPAAARDLEVTGPGVSGHQRSGDRVTVRFSEPVSGVVRLDLAWRAPPPGADAAPAPLALPLDGRGETWVSVVRGDESVLLPEPAGGLRPEPLRSLPDLARGLVPGEPLVAYRAGAGDPVRLQWRRLTFEPVDQPATLVDEADYTVVHAASGRVWMRATWQVRNDRNPFLRVDVPAGWRVFGLRVAGRTAEPARAADGRLLVPLEKSVETLDGLVAFPVELMLVGEERAWAMRGDRRLETPAIDAPIAIARAEVRLPDGAVARRVAGRASVVEQWTPDTVSLDFGRGVKSPAMVDGRGRSSGGDDGQALSQE